MNIDRQFLWRLGLMILWALLGAVLLLMGTQRIDARALAQESADDPPTIRRLHVQIMPEFDDPRVLVLVQGRLDVEDDALPQTVTVYLPRDAQINQMASINMNDGSTKSHPFDLQPIPEDDVWSRVTYSVESAHFFYEYYYDPLGTEPTRVFTYTMRTPLPVRELTVEVQRPHRSVDFALQPRAEVTRTDEMLGFTYGKVPLGELASEETASVRISYGKSDNDPSLSREELMLMQMGGDANSEMADSIRAQSDGTNNGSTWNATLVGGLLLLIVGGFAWYRTQSVGHQALPRSRQTSAEPAGERGFCTNCGSALKLDAHFCHVCGTSVGP
jgi:hypothetical protein